MPNKLIRKQEMHQRKKAFTLIELLVVIAIIALLLSILMPSLQKVKQHAQRLYCVSNIKSQALAFFTYAVDNRDKYPLHNSPLAYYMTFPGRTEAGNPWLALKDGYMTDTDILICPNLKKFGDIFGSTRFITDDGVYGTWETPTADYIRISYNWYANHAPPNSSGDLNFFGESPWPKDQPSSSSMQTIISHTVMQISGGFYDYSHNGSGSAATSLDLRSSDIDDNPIGLGDGSVTFRKKADMRPRATHTNDYYGYLEYYY